MATTTCPSCGAASTTSDYCDTCGAALAAPTPTAAASAGAPSATAAGAVCANCGAAQAADDAFCEGCGLDFATGQMPVAPAPAPVDDGAVPSGWMAVVEADRAFFDTNEAEGPTSITFPDGAGAREVPLTGDEVWIGRRSEAKGFFPAIDLGAPLTDPGVSHRHAVLRRQGDGSWALVDEMSTNGTWLNGGETPLPHGVLTALHDGDRINVGSFTSITIVHQGAVAP
ncbi:MAG: FHA domain-containing protein [Acidimicrobiales bacterium]